MHFLAFFFDFDGVLADSVDVKTIAFAKLFESYGPEIQAQVVDYHRKHGGMPRRDKFRYYYTELLKTPIDDVEMGRLCKEFSEIVVDKVIKADEIPGAESFLSKLHNIIPCYIVSATPDKEIKTIIKKRGLKKYFREVLGSSRTKSDNLYYLFDKFNYEPQKCLFFGDAKSDLEAAKALHIPFIGIIPGPDAPLLQIDPKIEWARNFNELNLEEYSNNG